MKTIPYFLMIFCLGLCSCKKDKPAEVTTGTVTDIEGNVYKTVKIGTQWWMAENLRTTHLNDNSSMFLVSASNTWADPNNAVPMVCYYDNFAGSLDKYGILYNGYAAADPKLAPAGWHVATDADWNTLQDYLIAQGYNYDGSTIDNKIGKSLASTTDWTSYPNTGTVGNDPASNNKSGFNGLPGGARGVGGTYFDIESSAYFWTSTEDPNNPGTMMYRALYYNDLILDASNTGIHTGMPVRCVKD